MEIPSGKIKVVAAQVSTSWWLANATVPIHPIMTAPKLNAPTSARYWQQTGNPTRKRARTLRQSTRESARLDHFNRLRDNAYARVPANTKNREMNLAMAEPRRPSAGIPIQPQTSATFNQRINVTPM